jgi:hypothetical protein
MSQISTETAAPKDHDIALITGSYCHPIKVNEAYSSNIFDFSIVEVKQER